MVGGMLKEGLEAGLTAAEGASMEDGAYQEIVWYVFLDFSVQ